MPNIVSPKELANIYLNSYGSADWSAYQKILDDGVEYEDSGGSHLRGSQELIKSLRDWKEGFADGRVFKIRSIVSENDMVVAEITWTGTHTDTLTSSKTASTIDKELSPTGKVIFHDAVLIFQTKDYKIVSVRHYYDMNDFMKQIAD